MANPEVTYELHGALAGRTIVLGGRPFVNGRWVTSAYSEEQHKLISRHLAQWRGERIDGKRDLQADGSGAVPGKVQPNGGGVEAGGPAPEGGGPADPEAVLPRPILESPGDRQAARLKAAIEALDPEVDAFWTQAGRPALAALEKALGSGGLTRAVVEAAHPGFVRKRVLNDVPSSD